MKATRTTSGNFRFICAALLACAALSYPAWGYDGKGDDVEATNAAIATNPPPSLAESLGDTNKKGVRLLAASNDGSKEYKYSATGDLRTWTSGSDITLYFEVTEQFTKIESASISLMAYDVDYPVATENDVTYFNGTPLGWRLQGGNNSWHANNNIPVPVKLIKIPDENNATGRNVFFVAVDVGNEGWVTCISEATLTIKGKVGLDVNASDGDEPEGVKVTWSSVPGATYTLYRGETDGAKDKWLYGGSDLEFLDTEAEPGKIYYYTVEASVGSSKSGMRLLSAGDTISGSNDGYYDAIIPRVDKMELPNFWLENKAPLAITWNKYDEKKFRVPECKLSIKGSCNKELTMPNAASEKRVVFDAAKDGSFSDNDFGVCEVEVSWKVDVFKDNVWTSYREGTYFVTAQSKNNITIYFNKYEGATANWYLYWPKSGAISGFVGDGGEFGYGSAGEDGNEGGGCTPSFTSAGSFMPFPEDYPPIYKLTGAVSHEYTVSDVAVSQGDQYTVGRFSVGSNNTGVELLAEVICHEKRHGQLADERYGVANKYFIGKHQHQFRFQTIEELVDDLKSKHWSSQYVKYTNAVISAYNRGDYVCDLDGDGILDSYEDGRGAIYAAWSFSSVNPDSHGVSSVIDSSYSTYGDNELLARWAETHPTITVTVDTAKDWAFPGTKINASESGLRKENWEASPAKALAMSTFDPFEENNGSSTAQTTKKANVLLANVLRGVSEGEKRMGGDLTNIPMVNDISGLNVSIETDFIDKTEDYSTPEGYSCLALALNIYNGGGRLGGVEVYGYLVDSNNFPIAFARTSLDTLGSGNTEVTLEFPGTSLHRIKSSKYRLSAVKLVRFVGDQGAVEFSKANFSETVLNYNHAQFVGGNATLFYNTFSESATSDALTIEVQGDVSVPGEYKVEARLEDNSGKFVASASAVNVFEAGYFSTFLLFSGKDIYLSRLNGPYKICYARIVQNGKTIDERRMPYTTAQYLYSDFTPANVLLVVDEGSFSFAGKECAIGSDGAIDSLAFSFDVEYRGDSKERCRVKMCLFGTNDTMVCSAEDTFSFVKGKNTVSLAFEGSRILSSGVAGPYYVKEVTLEPVYGAAERFFPQMEPIDLMPDDFGAFPFEVNGELKFGAKADGSGYELYVPLKIFRANTVTVSAMLVDATGQFVSMATLSKKYFGQGEDGLTLTFNEHDMLASERKGPYTVRFVQIESDIPGIDPVRAKVPEAAKDVVTSYTRYVDCNAAGGQADGYSWNTAFTSIQDAVDVADDGDMILVADGIYAPFDARNKAIEIKSVNGCEYTFINGGGTNRCATLGYEESQTNTVLTGFALFNGDASTDNVLVLWNCGGGVCCGTVRNCWIEGNAASKGGGAYYGALEGCVIAGNSATTYGGGSYYGRRVNCTIVGNTASYDGGGTYYGEAYNTIVLGNSQASYSYSTPTEDNYYGGDFAYCLTSPFVSGDGNITGDAGFRDAANSDYSLLRSSICVNSGSMDYMTTDVDIIGNPRVSGEAIDIGAFELKYSQYSPGLCDFVLDEVRSDEGGAMQISIFGGLSNQVCSVQLYLTYNTASAADLDLAKGSVNGEVPKGGLKFPLTVSWAAGETGEKTVEIPVKADTSLEPDEFFTLQIANPSGMDLGDFRVCTATIHDRNTSVTLADAINNQSLKPSTSGSSKWAAVESWVADPDETHCAAFAESPSGLLAGNTATLSLGSVKGLGTLLFDIKFVGEDVGGASFVEVYDGKKLLGTFTMSGNGSGWVTCQVYLSTSGSHTLSLVMTQGVDPASRVRIANVVWKPSSSYYFATLGIETYPAGAGFASGSGTYVSGSKIAILATPRPGHRFVGWYNASGYLFSTDAKTTGTLNWDVDLIALFARDPYVRALAEPADAGKVTGSGLCAEGKKVTLKATANKGYVFVGWYDERETLVTQAASLMVDNSSKPAKPSATTYVVTNVVSDATYYARFITVEEDKASISLTVGGNVFPVGSSTPLDAELPCGVWVDWPVVSAGLSQTTVKVSGLPSGLKYNANTGSIEGAASAPSKKDAKTGAVIPSVVKITVTTAGKSTKDFVVNLTIAEMSPEAVGTFNGFVSPYDSSLDKFYRALSTASFTLTTTAAGKIAAKTDSPKGAVSFSSNYWDQFADGMYSAFLVARTGEMMFLYVDGKPQYWNGSNHAYGLVSGGSFGSEMLYVEAQRSSFLKSGKGYEHPEAVELASAMQGTYRFDAEYLGDGAYDMVPVAGSKAPLTLTIKNTGAVTVAGTIPGTAYKFSATGTLRVYPSSGEAQIFAGGKSGKSVNVMVILNAALDPQTGSVGFSGNAFVNMVK